VTIPGLGDLAPPHRHVPVGRWLVTVLVVALLAGGGYAAFLGLSGGSHSSASQLPLCPPPSKSPVALKPGPLRLTVKNGTERNGLAASVQIDLENRGFKVTSIGNTVLMKKGVATVRYSADRRLVADKVAAQIKGAILVLAGGHGVVELDLGPKFHALATPKQAKAAYRRLLPQTTPAPTPSTSCRPRSLGSPSA
jgi:LytR cell envelope-related transcriptional attenuator